MSYPTFPSEKYHAVTPSDTLKLEYIQSGVFLGRCRALYVGGAGNVVVKNSEGDSITFTGVTAGSIIPVSTDQVMSTSTTATNIVALY